jgi:hypothetical protein
VHVDDQEKADFSQGNDVARSVAGRDEGVGAKGNPR